jgi:hypothetical protein
MNNFFQFFKRKENSDSANKDKLKYGGGVWFLIIAWFLLNEGMEKLNPEPSSFIDAWLSGSAFALIVAISIYILAVKKLHLQTKSAKSLIILLSIIIMLFSNFYLARYFYQNSDPVMVALGKITGSISGGPAAMKEELVKTNEQFLAIIDSIDAPPKDAAQANEYIVKLNQAIRLAKDMKAKQSQGLNVFSETLDDLDPETKKRLIEMMKRDYKTDLSMLSELKIRSERYYAAMFAALEARINYYDAYANDRLGQDQLFSIWDQLQKAWSKEEDELGSLKASFQSNSLN